jgi:hypothetical protein
MSVAEVQSKCETYDYIDSICNELNVLGRHRRQVMRRQFLVERPSEQCYRSELEFQIKQRTGEESGMTQKQSYDRSKKIRDVVIKTVSSDWPELMDLFAAQNDTEVEEAEQAFKDRLASLTDLDEDELNVAGIQSHSLSGEMIFRDTLLHQRNYIEKRMRKLAKELPVGEWWNSQKGCRYDGLALIISEAGNLSNYENPDKLKKRMGLTVYKGKAPATWKSREKSNGEKLSKAEWMELGYCPRRRSVMYNIGQAILQSGRGSTFWNLYFNRKREEFYKAREQGLEVASTTKTTADAWEKVGLPRPLVVKKVEPDKHRSCGHVQNRSLRYMEQQILIRLWAEWNGVWEER